MHIRATAVCLLAASLAAQSGYWAPLSFQSSPGARTGSALAYDSARDRLVMLGGTEAPDQTWENDGTQWTLRATTGPSGSKQFYPLDYIAAVYDSQRQRTVVLQSSHFNGSKTWEWDGNVWQLRTSGAIPPGRENFAMSYDSARGRTVLFGGLQSSNQHFSDTWEWDGTTWLQRSSGGPSPRQMHAMVFDSTRGVTLLFGGNLSATNPACYGDTWEWNGTYWLEHFGVGGPAPRTNHSMAFDPTRGVTVLHGGSFPFGAAGGPYYDTWEWNGTQWTNRQVTVQLSWAAMAADTQRRRVVLFGGVGSNGPTDATLAYAVTTYVASLTPYGVGCPGPTGVPLLAGLPGSLPRLGATLNLQLSNLPTSAFLGLGLVGFDNQSWNGLPLPQPLDPLGFPGCFAFLAPAQSYTLISVGGTAPWSIAIPFLPAFAGLQFYLQGGVFVLGFNPGGMVFSRALAVNVGV
jgi:hypothetical protein